MTWEQPFAAMRRGHSEGVTLRPIPNLKTLLGFLRYLGKKEGRITSINLLYYRSMIW